MENNKQIIETPVNIKMKIAFLWLFIIVGFLFHTQFELSELFVKNDIRMDGATGEVPMFIHYFRIFTIFLPLLFAVGTLYFEKKAFKISLLVYAILLGLLNTAHLGEEIGKEEKDLSQIILLSLIFLFNILLIRTLNKWRLGGKNVRSKPKFNMKYLLEGFRYAGLFIIISAMMGGLYGLISGVIIQPAMFAVVIAGVFVMINFVVSVLVWIFTLIFYSLGEQSPRINRYLLYSLGFALVYTVIFGVLKWSSWEVF